MTDVTRGTIVKLTSSPCDWTLGQVADVRSTEWGPRYTVVMVNGDIRDDVSTISEEGRLGIGWAIAAKSDIETHNRLTAAYPERILP